MTGENNLEILLTTMKPRLSEGEFVFCEVKDLSAVDLNEVIMTFREEENITIIIEKGIADRLNLKYSFVAAWITLTVHSSLSAVGLTAAFSNALSQNGISCNVVAACYHDHIFVDTKDAEKAIIVLNSLSNRI